MAVIEWGQRQWKKWVGDPGQQQDQDPAEIYEENVRWRRKVMRSLQVLFLFLTAAVPLASGAYFMFFDRPATAGPVALFGYFAIFVVIGFVVCRAQAQNLEGEIRTIEFESKIRAVEQENKEWRQDRAASSAINFFLKNEVELKRYYDQALRQSSLVFLLGVLCVLAGLAVVTGAGAAILASDAKGDEPIVLGALGAVGGLLSGFVARVYLGLHQGAVSSLAQFHTRFVLTHHLLFANVLVSEIDDKERRHAALHAVAQAIAHAEESREQAATGAGRTSSAT